MGGDVSTPTSRDWGLVGVDPGRARETSFRSSGEDVESPVSVVPRSHWYYLRQRPTPGVGDPDPGPILREDVVSWTRGTVSRPWSIWPSAKEE